jgi:hypothetical protein
VIVEGDLVLKYDLAETAKEAIMTYSKDLSISLEWVRKLRKITTRIYA